jgi:hypothetical protein
MRITNIAILMPTIAQKRKIKLKIWAKFEIKDQFTRVNPGI